MKEIWKRIPNVDGVFEVSNLGNVRKLVDVRHVIKKGYFWIHLPKHGKQWSFPLHRLVAEAFCEKNGGDTVDHIDGNKENNRADNLEWVSRSENVRRYYEAGGGGVGVCKYDSDERLVATYPTIIFAAKENKISVKSLEKSLLRMRVCARGEFFFARSDAKVNALDFDIARRSFYGNDPVPVVVKTLSGDFVKECSSINSAAKEFSVSKNTIRACLRGFQRSSANFLFEYKD